MIGIALVLIVCIGYWNYQIDSRLTAQEEQLERVWRKIGRMP